MADMNEQDIHLAHGARINFPTHGAEVFRVINHSGQDLHYEALHVDPDTGRLTLTILHPDDGEIAPPTHEHVGKVATSVEGQQWLADEAANPRVWRESTIKQL